METLMIKNIDRAAQRIQRAVEKKERIILYGDSDLDGIASTVILQETIKSLGLSVDSVVFPDRENDGYGVNLKALDFLKNKVPALFITLDLGIANVKEIAVAKEMGFEIVVIDHHEPLDIMPNADVIVDPKQPRDESDYRYLCNAGLTFKLCQALLGESISKSLRNSFLELVALATISDMVPQIKDNKLFIEEGLRSLKHTFRPGLRVFLDILGQGEIASGGHLKIISALNAAESVNFKNDAYVLLTNALPERCKELVEQLLANAQQKQYKIKNIIAEVKRRIARKPDTTIIFEGDPAWKSILAGPVASVIAQEFDKPTFIFKKGDVESHGSVRCLEENQNSVEAMRSCADLLITYGGHAKASGFRLKNENIEKFKACLETYFNR